MGDISKNFSWYEIAKGYDPVKLPSEIKENIRNLVNNVLQPARDELGTPIHITSGYRSVAHNRAAGGAKNSQHILGTAVDLYISATGQEAFNFFVKKFHKEIGGIGLYVDENSMYKFIHVDIRPKINGAITTWYFNGSSYVALNKKQAKVFIDNKIKYI